MMNTGPTFRPTGLLCGALLALAALAGPVAAQDADARWLAWLGCWEPVGETADGSLLCVQQAEGGVEVVSVMDGEVVGREILTADGARHDAEREGCRGWNRAVFSGDARRVYIDSEHRCEGETMRVSTGIIAMTSPHEWIEVESIDVGQRSVAWVKRYRAATAEATEAAGFADVVAGRAMAVESARMRAAAPVGVQDVIEAAGQVDPEAVEAWLVDANDPLDVDARGLLAMADAGVPEAVIDVVVAVSHPEHFALDRQEAPRDRAEYDDYYGHRPRGWFGYSSWYDRYYMGGYGFGSPWGYGGWSYGYRPSIVVVQPRGDIESQGHGRLIPGRGYRRSGGGGSAPSASPGMSGSGSGSVTKAGASGGSSSGATRKAKPRGGKPPGGI